MEVVYDVPIPSPVEDLEYVQSEEMPLELFPDNYESPIDSGLDQFSDDACSNPDPSCTSLSSPTSPHSSSDIPPVETTQFPTEQVDESLNIKREPPETAVYEPAVKREHTDESCVTSPQVTEQLLFPDLFGSQNSTIQNSYLQSLAKGTSEDIELYRNMLRCHGALTPELEKKLRHLSRQVKNRESAQISRKRKREYVELLRNALVKMRSVDGSLRSLLNSAQVEAAEKKSEAERWQTYAHDLQKLLKEHGIEPPKEPAVSLALTTVDPLPPFCESLDDVLPETLFDGPCGFGHMTPPKSHRNTSTTSGGKKRGPRSEKKQKQ